MNGKYSVTVIRKPLIDQGKHHKTGQIEAKLAYVLCTCCLDHCMDYMIGEEISGCDPESQGYQETDNSEDRRFTVIKLLKDNSTDNKRVNMALYHYTGS